VTCTCYYLGGMDKVGRKIGLGVLGAGRQGRIHINNIARMIPQAKLVAVADPNRENLSRLGVEGVRLCEDSSEIFNDSSIEAIVIASSTDSHEEMILRACRTKKHVFCEKPLALQIEVIDRCLDEVKNSGIKFMMGFNRRFDPSLAKIRAMVAEGKIGRPEIIAITSRDPNPPHLEYLKVSGGIFFDTTVHDFDMARYIMHDEIDEVYATGNNLFSDEIKACGDLDTAITLLKFKKGALGSINNSRRAVYGFDQRVEVFGSKGLLTAHNVKETHVEHKDGNGCHMDKHLYFFTERYQESYLYEIMHFIDALLNNTEMPVTGRDAKISVLLSMAAKKSFEENRPVKVDYSSVS
jgi:myo-inositol 2-dehydrogenase/D-chiro-inositol 1-dehydrogenase